MVLVRLSYLAINLHAIMQTPTDADSGRKNYSNRRVTRRGLAMAWGYLCVFHALAVRIPDAELPR